MQTETKDVRSEYGYRSVNIFDDKVTKNKIYRHLIDINDIITEEDIRNIQVSIPSERFATESLDARRVSAG